jgi:hypothetical protein
LRSNGLKLLLQSCHTQWSDEHVKIARPRRSTLVVN